MPDLYRRNLRGSAEQPTGAADTILGEDSQDEAEASTQGETLAWLHATFMQPGSQSHYVLVGGNRIMRNGTVAVTPRTKLETLYTYCTRTS